MQSGFGITVMAAALATTMATPLHARAPGDASEELAALRAQLAALTERIEELEGEVAETGAAPAESGTTVSWKGAPLIEGESGWSFKPRGRIQVDAGFTDAPDSTGRDDGFGSEIRRARLGVEGDIPGGFGYKFEVDFAGNETEVTDAILTYGHGRLTATIGQHNTFQGLEELTSSRFISMLERAAFTDAFGFERRVGASLEYGAGDVLLQGGAFTDNIEDLSNESWSVDGRAVFMPSLGETQLHIGGSAHYADYEEGTTLRYRQRPFVHFTDERFIDTASFGAESEFGLGLEAAAIAGPFHAAAEAFWQNADRPGALADPTFFGGYAEVGLFLTEGDTRGYKEGKFDRVKPASPVGEGGIGAVQLVLRYDTLDLTDAGIVGGQQNAYGVALIWTPTDYTRFMANYGRLQYDDAVHPTASDDTSYGVDAFGVRAQVDF